MNYFAFLDESGDHGLSKIDPNFPVFVLSCVVFSQRAYEAFLRDMNALKVNFWADGKVILHSRDIRKCEKEFKILLDYNIKASFYSQLDKIISTADYTIISVGIDKKEYIKRYGRISQNPYEIALSFIIERIVFLMDSFKDSSNVKLLIEKRGRREDRALSESFERVKALGTYYVSSERIKNYNIDIDFRSKKDNINGMQLADLVAYPIARHIMDEKRASPAFELIKPKIYQKNGKVYGLKIHP